MADDTLSKMRAKMVSDVAGGTDAIIARAILLATGQEWTLIDIPNRMHSVRYGANAGFSTIYLDGEPILELHDPHISSPSPLSRAPSDQAYTVNITQNYRFLGKAAEAANVPLNENGD